MIKLHAIQAKFGDCFVLEYGDALPEYILIDGGPSGVYNDHLRPALSDILKGKAALSDVIISHVDNDHIIGVLDLLTELQKQHDTGQPLFLQIGKVWFNTFGQTVGNLDIENKIDKVNKVAAVNGLKMTEMSLALNGIREGSQVMKRTRVLKIPVNASAPRGFYLAAKDNPVIQQSNLKIHVVGPTRDNLLKLQKEWEEWVKKNEQAIDGGKYTKDFAAAMDRSVPNLSSIVLLIEADGKSMLLTGDCRGDHLQQGLIETGLSADGKIHVDLFKVPHHGSKRNTTKKFFEEVTADVYVISADGTYDNPDDDTLFWIVESANAAGRKVKLVFTNETTSTAALLAKYKPEEMGYEMHVMKTGVHWEQVF